MSKQFVLKGAAVKKDLRIDYAKELNQEQLAAVLNGDGSCLVLAGAGSGKTRTITYRVAYLLEQGISPENILLLTFTNKASREMLERVERLLGSSVHGIWGGTFHSTANRLLRSYASELGFTSGFSILDVEDSKDLLKAVMKDMHIDPKERRFPSTAVCYNILSYARNIGGSIKQTLEAKHPNFVPLATEIEELARKYTERKRHANAMDFDDLLVNLLVILEDARIGESISSRFQYVLVDEYQDTNAIQARIVNRFARVHGNVFVVGDDAQSIYAFRGADVRNILSFPDANPNVSVFKLLTNYRSTPEILSLANDSLRHNHDQFEKDLLGLGKHGDKPSVIPCQSARQEAEYVAEQILELRGEGTALRNIVVLFRATSHSQQLELELIKRDIPYEYRGGQKFFERAHIKDMLAFLRIHQNPKDEAAWMRVFNLMTGIGATTAASLSQQAMKTDSLRDVIDSDIGARLSAKARSGWEEFTAIASLMAQKAGDAGEMIRSVADSSYAEILEREYPNWKDRLEDIEQFALFAESYEKLEAFLADVSLYDDVLAKREQSAKGDDERIIVSTIHQAKGLEWDTVFIIHLSDGAFPNQRAMAEEGGIEEERRLFYVAVTRAKKRLFLSYPLTMGYETLVLNRPSLFLDELDRRLTERIELVRSRGGRPTPNAGWGWDDSFQEETIQLDKRGERTETKWKSSPKKNLPAPHEFLSSAPRIETPDEDL